jgi:tetratricopeptide (TPR) repeat protein
MDRRSTVRITIVVLGAAAALGLALAASAVATNALFGGKEPAVAGDDTLKVSLAQAGDGSWEKLAVARAYYLGGQKEKGQLIIDSVLAAKPEASDYRRVLRIYGEAKEWDKALSAAEKLVAMAPKDGDDLAEAGAWYNLAGQREKAELLFARALAEKPKDVWVSAMIGGSYLGVVPLAQ